MKINRIAILLVASSMGMAMAATVRGGNEDRLLQEVRMDADDFEMLGASFDEESSTCKFTFKAMGYDGNKKTIKLDSQKPDVQDHKVVCREKGGNAEDNKDYDVKLTVKAQFEDKVKWTDKNGNDVKTNYAKVEWSIGGDGKKKIKLSIFKKEDTGTTDPEVCDDPHKNIYRDSGECKVTNNERREYRPTGSSDYFEDSYVVNCPSSHPKPFYWIVGTDEESCEKDKVCDCDVDGRMILCDVLLYKKDNGEGCSQKRVRVALNAFCCEK